MCNPSWVPSQSHLERRTLAQIAVTVQGFNKRICVEVQWASHLGQEILRQDAKTPRRQDAKTPRKTRKPARTLLLFGMRAIFSARRRGLFEVTRKTIATPYSRFFKQRRLGESEAERKD